MVSPIPATMTVPKFVGGRSIEWGEKEVPIPKAGELLVQVKANALCGSERPQHFDGSLVTPGHEAAGVIVAAGPGTKFKTGTPGVIFLMDFCGACRNCRTGHTNQCLNKRADMGFNRDGGYGPYELVHENIFFPVDTDLSLTDATMLLDVMGTTAHAFRRAEMVHHDIGSILISGAGPIGLGLAAMALARYEKRVPVYISDIVAYRLELAASFGAVPIDVSTQTLQERLRALGAPGVDLVVDSTGKSAARQAGLDSLNQRGVFVCVGHGEALTLQVSKDMIAPERAVMGSEYFQFSELKDNLALLRKDPGYWRRIITHRFPLKDINQAFELFWTGKTGKVVIEHA